MRLIGIAFMLALTACGSGNFSGGTETEKRPRKIVEAGNSNFQGSDDATGSTGDEVASDGSSKSGGKMPDGSWCPMVDQATLDALIASGKEFEVECEFEVEVEGAEDKG